MGGMARYSSRIVVILAILGGCALMAGCAQADREENSPYSGIYWDGAHVGQVDPIMMNGR